MLNLANQTRPIEPSAQYYWLAGLVLAASFAWGVQTAIDDEAFLLFLSDTVVDENSETGLTDPLHMIEQNWVDSGEGAGASSGESAGESAAANEAKHNQSINTDHPSAQSQEAE